VGFEVAASHRLDRTGARAAGRPGVEEPSVSTSPMFGGVEEPTVLTSLMVGGVECSGRRRL
jgi:hypothetical protein